MNDFDDTESIFLSLDPLSDSDRSNIEDIFSSLFEDENIIFNFQIEKTPIGGIFNILSQLKLGEISELLSGRSKKRKFDHKFVTDIIGKIKKYILVVRIELTPGHDQYYNSIKDTIPSRYFDRSEKYAGLSIFGHSRVGQFSHDLFFLKNKSEIESICKDISIFVKY